MTPNTSDKVAQALRKAYSLGQTYWQQADSDSYKQKLLSEATQAKFGALVVETCSALLADSVTPTAPESNNAAPPVAWVSPDYFAKPMQYGFNVAPAPVTKGLVPLYAHPPRAPLTDADIDNLIHTKHFYRHYIKSISDAACLDWYRLGVRDAEHAHGIKAASVGAAK